MHIMLIIGSATDQQQIKNRKEAKVSEAGVGYLLIDVRGPEAGGGTIIGIRGEDGRAGGGPGLIDVLDDDEGLTDRAVGVKEDRDLLVDRVGPEEELTLGAELLLQELVLHPLQVQRDPRPHHEWARPAPDQLHLPGLRHFNGNACAERERDHAEQASYVCYRRRDITKLLQHIGWL